MTQIETHSLRIERTYTAPLQKVRKALTDPAALAKWFAPGPMHAVVHSCDERVGGQWEISMVGRGEDGKEATHTCTGLWQELTPTRVVTTFNWTGEPLPNDTLLAYDLSATDTGTRLVLRHTGFPIQEAADMHTEGWEGCLAKLPEAF